jgi:hypothetical protein
MDLLSRMAPLPKLTCFYIAQVGCPTQKWETRGKINTAVKRRKYFDTRMY